MTVKDTKWAENHNVYSREITLRLIEELGYFEKVEFLRSVSRWVGTGYKDYIYVIDGKWQVIKVNTKITKKGKIIFTNLDKV